jgi:hypothetical protein
MDILKPEYNIQKIAGIILFPGHTTTLVNTITNSIKTYNSMKAAAKDINVCYTTLANYVDNPKLLKNTYLVFKNVAQNIRTCE